MRCTRCPAIENVRKIKPFGLICYKCFEEMTNKMLRYREDWFNDAIFPQIKMEIIDNIRTEQDFNLDDFIENSEYEAEVVELAIEEMVCYETLPEDIRGFLCKYRGYEIELDEI